MQKAFTNARIYTGKRFINDKAILVTNGIIDSFSSFSEIPSQYQVEDMDGMNIAPAFIDMQIYGGNGKMFSHELNIEALKSTYEYCMHGGASHFMITMATNSIENFNKGIDAVEEYWLSGGKGLLGLHLEGPYLNPVKKGAHIEKYIKRPQLEEVKSLIERKPGIVRMMTIAPEVCSAEVIDYLIQTGIIVSAGHTNANYKEAISGFVKGIPTATHLFNAMSPLMHREPGMVGAIFDHPTVMSSLVCDGIHVDYPAIRIGKKILNDRLFFITDAVTDIRQGEYIHIYKGDRFTLPDGTLSGSSLTMMQSVKNGVNHAGIAIDEALRMASTYPARLLGPGSKLGKLEQGYEAEMVVFDDQLNVLKVISE